MRTEAHRGDCGDLGRLMTLYVGLPRARPFGDLSGVLDCYASVSGVRVVIASKDEEHSY